LALWSNFKGALVQRKLGGRYLNEGELLLSAVFISVK